MKKINLYILSALTLGMLSFTLEAASNVQATDSKNAQSVSQKSTTIPEDDEDDDYDDDDEYDDEDDDWDDEDDDDDWDDEEDDEDDDYNILKNDKIDKTAGQASSSKQ